MSDNPAETAMEAYLRANPHREEDVDQAFKNSEAAGTTPSVPAAEAEHSGDAPRVPASETHPDTARVRALLGDAYGDDPVPPEMLDALDAIDGGTPEQLTLGGGGDGGREPPRRADGGGDDGADEPPRVKLYRNPDYPDEMTVGEARLKLAEEMAHDLTNCPVCGCLAHVAKRSIHTAQAVGLVRIARAGGFEDYVDTAKITASNATMDVAKSKWWDLIVELEERRDDGGRAGWWKLTSLGRAFVYRQASVQKYVHVFDNRVQWRSGPLVSIVDCLHNRFDWHDLMYG